MDLASGGHLRAKPTLSGKVYTAHAYGVNEKGYLDYNEIEELAKICKPKMIIAGAHILDK